MELDRAIKERRSIRSFNESHITDEQLREILTAAKWAPSWKNSQTWHFIIVRDKNLIEKIAEHYSTYNRGRKASIECSALVICCAKNNIAGYHENEMVTKFDRWNMFDLALAVQNMLLKAHEMGIGSLVIGYMNHDKIAELVELPEGYDVYCTVSLGKYDKHPEPTPRKELSEFCHKEKFGEKF